MTTIRVIARRKDGNGFVIGKLESTTYTGSGPFYHVKSLSTGRVVKLSGRDYTITPVS